jgi:hypothetical protein
MGLNLQNLHMTKVVRTTATLSIAVSGTPQVIPFEAAVTGGTPVFGGPSNAALWVLAAPTRVTIQKNGWYNFFGGVEFAANATGDREIYFYKNGVVSPIGGTSVKSSTVLNRLATSTYIRLVRGDYMELWVNQTCTAALNVNTTAAAETPYIACVLARPEYDFVTSEVQ